MRCERRWGARLIFLDLLDHPGPPPLILLLPPSPQMVLLETGQIDTVTCTLKVHEERLTVEEQGMNPWDVDLSNVPARELAFHCCRMSP